MPARFAESLSLPRHAASVSGEVWSDAGACSSLRPRGQPVPSGWTIWRIMASEAACGLPCQWLTWFFASQRMHVVTGEPAHPRSLPGHQHLVNAVALADTEAAARARYK